MLRILIFVTVWAGCTRKTQSISSQNQILLEMTKSPCFGFCPVYQLTLYQNGLMKLNAKQNMKITGIHTKQLSKDQIKHIKSSLLALHLDTYKDEYREPIADAPATEIIYHQGTLKKKIFTNFLFPDALQKITEELNQEATDTSWVKWDDPRIKKEFIVMLQEGAALIDLLQKFTEYELMMVKRLDPATSQYWLLTGLVIPGEEEIVLNKLKKEPGIKEAQFNKTLDTNR